MSDASAPGLRPGAAVGEIAAETLLTAAHFFDSADSPDKGAREGLRSTAAVCRKVAAAVAKSPMGNSSRVLAASDLDGRFHTDTEQMWTTAEVASALLSDAARMMETVQIDDRASRNSLLETAHLVRRVVELLDIAPCAAVGPRLTALLPYLKLAHGPVEDLPISPVSHLVTNSAMENAEFEAIAQEVYQMAFGMNLDDRPIQQQWAWAGRLARLWFERAARVAPLTAEEAEQIAHAARNPRTAWTRTPMVPGEWDDLAAEDAAGVLRLIGASRRVGPSATPFPLAFFCDRVRSRPLACFSGAVLVEVQGVAANGQVGIASFLLTDDTVEAIDGNSAWIHDLNDRLGPHLFDDPARLDYLLLFLNHVRNGGERFQAVARFDYLADRARDPSALRALCDKFAHSIMSLGYDPEGRWLFEAVVCYQDSLFAAVLAMAPNGVIDMIEDDLLAEDIPIHRERQEGLFIVLADDEGGDSRAPDPH